MNVRKLTASLTALACSAGMFAYFPAFLEKTYAMEVVYNDFEVNYGGWYGNTDAVTLTAENGIGCDGSRGMVVSGRTNVTDGASAAKGFYLAGGVEYTYRMQVYSDTVEQFHLSLLCVDMETGEETETELDSAKNEAGKWTELSADYTAPENNCEFRLTITTDSIADFCFDEVKVTAEQSENRVSAATTEKGLKDEFANYFRVGNILNGSTVQNSTITASMLKDYNSIECENELKPDATLVQSQCSNTNIGVSLSNAASIMDFCVNNNLAMRGHTLVWHSQTPTWFFKENFNASGNWVSSSVMDQRMESYIKNMFDAIKTQYPDLNLYAYDVANECISDDSNRTANFGGSREPGENISGQSPWVQVYGDNSFVEKAFTYARKYAPEGCDLYYNDYNEYWDHKRDAIYSMCKSLYEKGLLDGIGMQSHINANYDGFSGMSAYTTAMKKFLSIGCDLQVTELDISTENGTYTAQQQADKYKAIFQAAMDWNKNPSSTGRVTAVCIWGPNDANTWIKTENAPLLYDTNHQPKLAYTTLTAMIPQSEWGDGSNVGGEIKPNEYGWYFHSTFEGDAD
ncbi:MAG: endo-1,4-beta-xylanase, partial [Oscillospiraceae bacterium]|nr:endo-1,4-beta-xylanase [Oscillospiraceae bacterium]